MNGSQEEVAAMYPSQSVQLPADMKSTDPLQTKPGMKRVGSAPGLARPETEELPKITIGVCAMDKKARSKQMNEIVGRLVGTGEFEVIIFGDDTILNKPVEDWPICQCLLSWHSEGFPLKKAQAYVSLRKPYLVNDAYAQDILLDRRKVYRRLLESGIPVPMHIIISRDNLQPGHEDPEGFIETEDYVELEGVRINKPFVEKPASGEDHNVYIYYPHSMGGGVKRLFRKVDNKSADYDPTHPGTVRRDGSYIYEEFLPTGGTDVKVYTVGPRYAHAEARKSPVVDGKVQRTADGKEVRFPVLLSPQEKEIARMVCLAFGQRVCGFDLLRSERGKSYVCDVNGWSFVKNSYKYYDDTAGILRMIILSAVAPHRLLAAPSSPQITRECLPGRPIPGSESTTSLPYSASYDDVHSPLMGATSDSHNSDEELRCVLAVIRHGDRTPKQKMKMKVTQPSLLDLLHKYLDSKGKQAKLKSPNELQELLDVTRALLEELDSSNKQRSLSASSSSRDKQQQDTNSTTTTTPVVEPTTATLLPTDPEADETREKFRIMKTVLEQGGQFAGINRKVQLKPLRWAAPEDGSEEGPRVTEALLILKHGGVLTHAGRQQAENLGTLFRTIMYPQSGPQGGLLRLHSTYRHDLKIYSSDEGRVQSSAAAFTKGLLDLEGSALTPILVSLVKKDAGMLDAFGKGASADINLAKQELYAQMTWDQERNVSAYAEPQVTTAPPFVGLSSINSGIISPPMSPSFKPFNTSGADGNDGGGGGNSAASSPAPPGRPNSGNSIYPFPTTFANSSRQASIGSLGSSNFNFLGDATTMNVSFPSSRFGSGSGIDGTNEQPIPGSSNIPGRPHIYPMPENPLQQLRKLYDLLKDLVDGLRQKCLDEPRSDEKPKGYSALLQDPKDWQLEEGKPCSGEKLLLLFDRWRKLLKAFYSEKKGTFDISKVPDIYDAAKYDAIHNLHLGVDTPLKAVYEISKVLAAAVIPNEYGIQPSSKLRIGSMICAQLLGKLLCDLASMREESFATSGLQHSDDSTVADLVKGVHEGMKGLNVGLVSVGGGECEEEGIEGAMEGVDTTTTTTEREGNHANDRGGGGGGGANNGEEVHGTEHEEDGEDTVLHRLCPTYAQDINSPLRHVRTRIYFTSESHCHSLINVLRYCQLGSSSTGTTGTTTTTNEEGLPPLCVIGPEGQQIFLDTQELDYMTQIVFRMFENKKLPLNDPKRFRVEILFSPGAAYNPFERKEGSDHVLPVMSRVPIQVGEDEGVPLATMETMCKPYSKPFKRVGEPYSLRAAALDTQASEIDYWM